jgi:hypothetical protein
MKKLLSLLLTVALTVSYAGADTPPPSGPLADGLKAVSGYDYGTDRTDIVAFDNYIRSQSPESRAKIEAALLPLLDQANLSLGAKNYICRWLGVIGTDASVPTLEKLTQDMQLSHQAVYALLSIDTPAARSALTDSLGTVPAALRPAIIGAIGRADVADAVPALAKIATLDDPAQVTAALDALGAIGSSKALAALRDASVPAPLEANRQWALLHAAFHVLKTSPSADAPRAVFASLLKPGAVSSLRVAAAKGYIEADHAEAWPEIAKLLKDNDVKVRLDVARLVAQFSPVPTSSVTGLLPSLDPAVQVVVINSLAEKRGAEAEPVLKAALAGNQPDVHLAAIAGYGTADVSGAVPILLAFLDRGGDEAAAATLSLEQLTQPGVSARLKTAEGKLQGAAKAAVLTILGARADRSALDLFFASSGDADNQIAEAAFQGISLLASGSDLNRVIALMPQVKTGAEHNSLQLALIHCTRNAADKDQASDSLLTAVQQATPDNKATLIVALASVDSPKAIANLQTLLQAPSVDDRKSVIRALSLAHAPGGDKLLLQAAAQGTDPSEKILALRGYLDSVRAQNLHEQQRVEAYRAAWPVATRQDDKQAILDALKNMNGRDAQKAYQELSASAPNPA